LYGGGGGIYIHERRSRGAGGRSGGAGGDIREAASAK
jgi:hypothetical protein